MLVPTDINGDGKTDIVYSRTTTYNSTATGSIYVVIHHNTNADASNRPVFGNSVSTTRTTNVRHDPIPIFLNPDRQNANLEYGYISDGTITLFNSHKDMLQESQIAQVSQDGVTHNVHYSRLMPDSYVNDLPLYQGSLEQTFPYIDIEYAPQLFVVDRVSRTAVGQTVQQVFGYGKAVSNADGLGFLGFGETIRSNLHINSLDSNRMFTIGIQNPQLRGANMRNFTSKSSFLSSTIKDMPLTDPPPAGGVADGATLWDYVNRQDQVYHTDTLPNKVFVNIPVAASTKDLLRDTYQNQRLQYDSLYNLTHTWADINGTATRSSGMVYANDTATSSYHIGRLLSQQDTTVYDADTTTSEVQYAYTGYLPTEIKTKGHHTDFVIDSLAYDVFGNVTERTTAVPGGEQRTETMEYDTSGRFLTEHTDADNLSESYNYYSDIGQVETYTDAYGRTENYTYDTFGRLASTEDYLSNTYTQIRSRSGTNIHISYLSPDGAESLTIYDALGQQIEERTNTVLGTTIGRAWQYDAYGRQTAESEPSDPNNYTQWNTVTYDSYGRVQQNTSFTGKTHTYSYSGLSGTVNDSIKSVTTTQDALGNTIRVQDPGGTVEYRYFADGNLRTTDYGGSIQTIEQDGWGRKTKLTDPSAGVYTYEYDGWGQITEETTPKGETLYEYDTAGKLTGRTITGDSTDMQQTYTYNTENKLLTGSSLINADGNNTTYTYTYDTWARLGSSSENNIHAVFDKSYTYDSFGRLDTESIQAEEKENSQQSETAWQHHYANGELEKITLNGTGQVLWEIDSLDTKGLLTRMSHGSSQFTRFAYDTYGFPEQQQVMNSTGSTPTTLLTLGNTFDAQRGFPTARSSSAFSWNETFSYDDLDRLTVFNDNDGNHSQQYDARGRITENSRQGTYSYDGNSYHQQELELTSAAGSYYQARELQNISYNAFKSPVEIHEPGHDRISFQYNGALGRSHMYYGGEQEDPLDRRYRRHYAEDGSAEITADTQTGEVSFVFYLGGDAYSAPAIWKETRGGTAPTSSDLYFLHRDYLGSIVMITDSLANIAEKRHFDAWGNIIKLTDGNDNNLPNFGILDRGYTGHEHLLSVALIHMNGRLYDARLGRFLAPDNYVQDPFGTQNFNRYGYALNNPMVYVDPDGEFIISILVGIGVGILANGISNAIQDRAFFDGWIQAGIMGGVGGYVAGAAAVGATISATSTKGAVTTFTLTLPASVGQQALASAIGVASTYIPGLNIPLGDNFSIGINPAILFGGAGWGAGASTSVNYHSENFSAGISATGFYGKNFITGAKGIQGSVGGTVRYKGISYSGTRFLDPQGNYSHGITVSGKNWSVGIENDFLFSDKYRTTALNASIYDVGVGVNLWTGDPGPSGRRHSIDGTHYDARGLYNPDQYRSGMLFLSYNNHRIGVDSERYVRAPIQNGWHAVMRAAGSDSKNFRVLDIPTRFYGSYNRLYPYSYY